MFTKTFPCSIQKEIVIEINEENVKWDKVVCRYNNITDTRLPWDKVWTPDIVLYNRWGTTLWLDWRSWCINRNTCGCILCNTFCMFKRIKRCKLTAVSWITNTDGVVCSAGDGEQGREMRTLIQVSVFCWFVLCMFVCCAVRSRSALSYKWVFVFFALLVGLYFACWFVAHIYCLLHTFSGYLVYISVSVYISKSLDLSFIDGCNCFLSLSGWLPRKRDSSDPGDLYDKMSNWCDPLPIWSTGDQNSFPSTF